MALFPCDICRKRYPGKSQSAYLGWVAGGFSDRKKFNLCPRHMDQLEDKLQAAMALIEVGGVMQTDDVEISSSCEKCGLQPTTQTWFAHTYPRTKDVAVYARGVCQQCSPTIEAQLVLAP